MIFPYRSGDRGGNKPYFRLLATVDTTRIKPFSIQYTRMYSTNLTAHRLCTIKYFLTKTLFRLIAHIFTLFFWHLLRTNWSIVTGTVSLWKMFESSQIVVFEGKCRRFRILKIKVSLCASNNWPIWTQKVQKEA